MAAKAAYLQKSSVVQETNFLQQVDLDASVSGAYGQEGVADLLVVPASESTLWEVLLNDVLFGDRAIPADSAIVQGVGGQADEDLARECVVLRMQWPDLVQGIEDVPPDLNHPQQESDRLSGFVRARGPMWAHSYKIDLTAARGPQSALGRPRYCQWTRA